MLNYIKEITKGERKWIDIIYFFEGNIRYKLYYSKFDWIIRKHIREQIRFRLKVMNPECYSKGACIKCGCETPHLQMCYKSCEGNCYPPLMSKKKWQVFFWNNGAFNTGHGFWILYNNKPIFFREENHRYVQITKTT